MENRKNLIFDFLEKFIHMRKYFHFGVMQHAWHTTSESCSSIIYAVFFLMYDNDIRFWKNLVEHVTFSHF